MIKKLIFVLLILLSAVSFAEKTDQSTAAAPTPKERAAQIINGKTSPYPDILNHRGTPRGEDFTRPAIQRPTILP